MLKILRVYMSIYSFRSNSAKLEVVKSTPLIGDRGKTYRESTGAKKGNYLIGYSLHLSWLFVIGCPWCLNFVHSQT